MCAEFLLGFGMQWVKRNPITKNSLYENTPIYNFLHKFLSKTL